MSKIPSAKVDMAFLKEAAKLGRSGKGEVEPNPMVGALVVRNGSIVGKGRHVRYGGPHAEVAALKSAGSSARRATLYISLEPCSSHGKTPPCTERILKARMGRVVIGAIDPDPRHKGLGIALLEKEGIKTTVLKERSCENLLADFVKNIKRKRPYIILKWASTLDGHIAAADSSSQWISCAESRRSVHILRGHVDAVMTGRRTVALDDPSLNCRLKRMPLTPLRIVLDPRLKTPPSARLFKNIENGKDEDGFNVGHLFFVAGPNASKRKALKLEQAGAEMIFLKADPSSRVSFIKEAMVALRKKGIKRLMVEGGSGLFTSIVEAKLADQLRAYIAPKVVGGKAALSPIEGQGIIPMSHALKLKNIVVKRTGDDIYIRGIFPWSRS